ncbi:MAG: hypothetical protein ACE5JK_08370, partial [Candidatus Omnitrophota bacterium]
MTLANKGITVVDIDGNVHEEKVSPFEWLESSDVEDIYFLQCDMVYNPELLRSMVYAKNKPGKKLDLVAVGYDYPPGSEYQLGTVLRRRCDREVDFEVVEHRDRTPQVQELIERAKKSRRIPAYAGALGIDLSIARRLVLAEPGRFIPYIHWNKQERLEDGAEIVVNKIQFSLTNLFQITDKIGVLMVPFEDVAPMKDPQKLAFVRASLGNRHKELLKTLGVEAISEESKVEISPLAQITRIGKNVSVGDNARVFFGGSPDVSHTIEIGDNVTFEENVTVKITGDSPVFVGDNVKFRGEGTIVLENSSGERLSIPNGSVIETGKGRSPHRGKPLRSIMEISDGELLNLLPSRLNREHVKRVIRIFDILWGLGGGAREEEGTREFYRDIFHKLIIAHAMGSSYGSPEMLKPFRPPDEYYRVLGENNIIIPREIDLFLRYSVFRDKKATFQKIDEVRYNEGEEINEETKKWLKRAYILFVIADSIETGADYLRRVEVRRLRGEEEEDIETVYDSFMFAQTNLEEAGVNLKDHMTNEAIHALAVSSSNE